jgi:glycosyltransferase involved in cell wall biosynthesis
MKITCLLDEFPVVSQTFVTETLNAIPSENLEAVICGSISNKTLWKSLPNSLKSKVIFIESAYPTKKEKLHLLLMNLKYINPLFKIICRYKNTELERYIWQSLRVLKKLNIDASNIIHTEFAMGSAACAYFINLMVQKKYTITVHGVDLREPLDSIVDIFKNSEVIFAPSEFHKMSILQFDQDLTDIVQVIPLGINVNEFPLKEQRYDNHQLLKFTCVARLHPVKNHKLLLDAFSRLCNQFDHVELNFVGGGELELELIKQTKDLGISKNVVFWGEKNQDEIQKILSQSDIFILSSISEGLSIAALEAAACGLALISTNVGGMSELVENNITGLLVDAGDEVGLYLAMKKLYEDRGLIAFFGLNAREKVSKYYDKKNCFKAQLQAWETCIVKKSTIGITEEKTK